KRTSWWQTLPGVLTAVAGVVTAVGGLIAVLVQSGIIGTKGERPSAELENEPAAASSTSAPAATSSAAPEESTPTTESATASNSMKPWQEAQAVIHLRDGTTTRIRASSLSNCISVSHEIELNGAQSIPFEKMRALEVLRADEHTIP